MTSTHGDAGKEWHQSPTLHTGPRVLVKIKIVGRRALFSAYVHTHTSCICIYIYVYICIYMYIHTYMHACMLACLLAYLHKERQIDRETDRHSFIHACMHAYLHICIHIYITYIFRQETNRLFAETLNPEPLAALPAPHDHSDAQAHCGRWER